MAAASPKRADLYDALARTLSGHLLRFIFPELIARALA